MTGFRSIRDFIFALMNKDEGWASARLILINQATKKNYLFELIEDYRNYAMLKHAHKTHTHSHSTFSAGNQPPQDSHQPQQQSGNQGNQNNRGSGNRGRGGRGGGQRRAFYRVHLSFQNACAVRCTTGPNAPISIPTSGQPIGRLIQRLLGRLRRRCEMMKPVNGWKIT